jgi:hypothetical protein
VAGVHHPTLTLPKHRCGQDCSGPVSHRQYLGFSECAVEGPTAKCLKGRVVIGLYFSANWCHACSEFTPVLERLYTVQKAQGADQLEVVLVSR